MNDQTASAELGNALVTKFAFANSDDSAARSLLVKFLLLSSEAPGFISGEILAPKGEDERDWTLVHRFQAASAASAWKQSKARSQFLAELESGAVTVTEEDQVTEASTVTSAITTHVKSGMESAYREWEGKVQIAQVNFPGFKGSYFQPDTGANGVWVSLLRFDNADSMDRWFNSPVRQQLVNDVSKLVTSTDIQRVVGSFPGWIPVDAKTGKGPPNWKAFLLVLLGLYPIVTMEIRYLMPLLSHIPSAPANLFANALSVAATTWLTMPLFVKWFGPWMFPAEDSKPIDNLKWLALIAFVFMLELAALWKLL